MSTPQNALQACSHGLGCSWADFDWGKYPGGIKVTFALVNSRQLMLIKPTRWNFVLPDQVLNKSDTLEDVLAKMHAQLSKMHIRVSVGKEPATILGMTEMMGTLHVILLVPVVLTGGSDSVEMVSKSHMLSGLSVSNPTKKYLPKVLGWADPDFMFDLEKQLQAA